MAPIDLPKELLLQIFMELKILGIPHIDDKNIFTPDIEEVAAVTDSWPIAEKMGLSRQEFREIKLLKIKVANLREHHPNSSKWIHAQLRGNLWYLQLQLVERRLIQIKSQMDALERDLANRQPESIRVERLEYLRFLVWSFIRFLRVSTDGHIQDVEWEPNEITALSDTQILSNELGTAHSIIKAQRKRIKALERRQGKPTRKEMKSIIDETRKKNDKANYSEVGRALGITGETAKKWIENLGLLNYADPTI